MSDAEEKKEMAYPKRFSQLQQTYTEKRASANWRASDKCGIEKYCADRVVVLQHRN